MIPEIETYFFAMEFVSIFILFLLILFTKESLNAFIPPKTNLFRRHALYFYKHFVFFQGLVIGIALIIHRTHTPPGVSLGLRFVVPIISVFLMLDIVRSLYLYDLISDITRHQRIQTKPSLLVLIGWPFMTISAATLMGAYIPVPFVGVLSVLAVVNIMINIMVKQKLHKVNLAP